MGSHAMHGVVRDLVISACGACLLAGAPAGAQPVAPPPNAGAGEAGAVPAEKRRVCHLRLEGDLDNARLVGQFAEEIGRLRGEHVEMLVMEIGANRWRADVVAGIISAADAGGLGSASGASKPISWIVWLNDPTDGRVGTGAAALAVAADRCYMGLKTEVAFDPDDDARDLAPPAVAANRGQAEQDLRGVIWGRLNARAADPLLASALPLPTQPLWVVHASAGSAAPLRIVSEDPARHGLVAVAALVEPATGASAESGAMRLRMDAETAVGLGLAGGRAKEVGQIIAARHVLPRPLVRRDLRSGLADARARLTREFEAIDAARERLDASLDEAERLRGHDAARQRARVGAQAATMADEATKRLLEVEALITDYPELLCGAPPGQTPVGVAASRLGFIWNEAFQSRREALTGLRNRAARLTD